jgi:hypothetical protein
MGSLLEFVETIPLMLGTLHHMGELDFVVTRGALYNCILGLGVGEDRIRFFKFFILFYGPHNHAQKSSG